MSLTNLTPLSLYLNTGTDFGVCPSGFFKCRNNNCIPSREKCNGQDNCGDASDEVNCGMCIPLLPFVLVTIPFYIKI